MGNDADVLLKIKMLLEGQDAPEKAATAIQKMKAPSESFTQNLKEQKASLREFNPLLNQMGVGFLGAATFAGIAVGGVSLLTKSIVDLYQANKSAAYTFTDLVNVTAGGKTTIDQSVATLNKLRMITGYKQPDVAEAFGYAAQAIPNQAAAENFLTMAASLARDLNLSGAGFTALTKELATAQEQGYKIGGQQYPAGDITALLNAKEQGATDVSKARGAAKLSYPNWWDRLNGPANQPYSGPTWGMNRQSVPPGGPGQNLPHGGAWATVPLHIFVHQADGTIEEINTQMSLQGGGD